jgi:hypothetical protein
MQLDNLVPLVRLYAKGTLKSEDHAQAQLLLDYALLI